MSQLQSVSQKMAIQLLLFAVNKVLHFDNSHGRNGLNLNKFASLLTILFFKMSEFDSYFCLKFTDGRKFSYKRWQIPYSFVWVNLQWSCESKQQANVKTIIFPKVCILVSGMSIVWLVSSVVKFLH